MPGPIIEALTRRDVLKGFAAFLLAPAFAGAANVTDDFLTKTFVITGEDGRGLAALRHDAEKDT